MKKVISLLFIALVLTNLVHNAIPHHHHLGNAPAHECCDHQACDSEALGALEDCTHCEAFNGMDYYPSPQNIKVRLPKLPGTDLFYREASLPELNAPCPGDLFASADPPDPYQGPEPGIISLRGPPSPC